MSTTSDDPANSVVLDRELDEGKTQGPSEPRIHCPLCGWSPRKEDKWRCTRANEWNTFDTGGVRPACLSHWTEAVPFVQPMVAAFGLVCEVTRFPLFDAASRLDLHSQPLLRIRIAC